MSQVYAYPQYYEMAYRWNTDVECDFIEACLARWGPQPARHLLDIGCGAGRHVLALAARGYTMTGIDPQPAMVRYARRQARRRLLPVTVARGTLDRLPVTGQWDVTLCLMDTFRFLLSDASIIAHLRAVATRTHPAGLYIIDCWMPETADGVPCAQYDWEQTDGTLQVRVDYHQYADSWNPADRTFDDELIFHVSDGRLRQTIRGGRTPTRLLWPDELRALVTASRAWQIRGQYAGFDLERPDAVHQSSWRVVTVLQREAMR